jgi:hypothetical protein
MLEVLQWIHPQPMFGIWGAIIAAIATLATGVLGYVAQTKSIDAQRRATKKALALEEKRLDQSFAATRTFGEVQAQQQAAAASDNGQLIQWGVVGVMIIAVLFVLAGKK